MKNIHYLFTAVFLCQFTLYSCENKQQAADHSQSADTVNIEVPEEENGFSFLIIGDWGRCGDYFQKEVSHQMNIFSEKTDAEFIVSTGDNFYDNGVRSTEDAQWDKSFEDIYTGSHLQKNWYVILGNHDYHGNPQAEIDYSKKSRRWNMPSRYYTIKQKVNDSVDARLIFIDTNPFIKKYHKEAGDYADIAKQDTTKQLRWLDSLLAHSTEPWKIIVGHHPLYSSSSKHGNAEELITVLKPMMEKYHVQMYIAGHEHDLQHLKPENSTVDYIVSGAGSEVRPTGKNEMTKFSASVGGFAVASINNDSLKLYFVDDKGKMIYNMSRGR